MTEPQLQILTEPKILSVPAHLIHLVTDPADPKYGLLADKLRATEKADPALVESMRLQGFTSLTQSIQAPDGRLIAVTGRRRTRAALEAGVAVRTLVTPEDQIGNVSAFSRTIAENELRKEDDIFNKADKAFTYRAALVEPNRPQVPNPDALGETMLDPNWTPGRAEFANATKETAKLFGYLKKGETELGGKFYELLSLHTVIEAVRKAVRAGQLSVTELLARKYHTLTPAQQQTKLEKFLAKKAVGEQESGVEAARAEERGASTVLSKSEQLLLVSANSCPVAVKAFVRYAHGILSFEELAGDLGWINSAKGELELTAATEARQAEERKALKEQEKTAAKALKAQQKAEAEASKAAAKAQAAAERLAAKKMAKAAAKAAKAQKASSAPLASPPVTVVEL